MQPQEIAARIAVSRAETAKLLQLLVWGGFVASRRGSKGGFHLSAPPDQITTGEVISFFLAKHPPEADGDCPVMRALCETVAPCQEAFGKLTLASVAAPISGTRLRTRTKGCVRSKETSRVLAGHKRVVHRRS
jgi:DNA-binding IscR family transcriptional regulator